MASIKKFYFLLFLMIVLVLGLFYVQFKKMTEINVKKTSQSLVSENPVNIPLEDNDPALGNPGATVTVVLFMDLNCKECRRVYQETKKFVTEHPLDARLVWKDAPPYNFLFKGALPAHEAAICAGAQDEKNFWNYIDALIINGKPDSGEQNLKQTAQALRLDLAKWWACYNSKQPKEKIDSSIALSKNLGIASLPAVFVNNKMVNTEGELNIYDFLEKLK